MVSPHGAFLIEKDQMGALGVLKELKFLPKTSGFKATDLKRYKINQYLQRKQVKRR